MTNFTSLSHPELESWMNRVRDRSIAGYEFAEAIAAVSHNLFNHAMQQVPSGSRPYPVVLLRAGAGMLAGIYGDEVDEAGFIGVMRNEADAVSTIIYQAVQGHLGDRPVFVLDPALATGGSMSRSVSLLKERYGALNIWALCIIAAPEGIKRMNDEHPDVTIVVAAVDECLDSQFYIVPGFGDAGDRLFGVKG